MHGAPKFCTDVGKILVKGGATILAVIEAETPEVWTVYQSVDGGVWMT